MKLANAAVAVVVALLVACGGSDAAPQAGAEPGGGSDEPSATASSDLDFIEDTAPVDAAVADLRRRLDVDAVDIEVGTQQEVSWRDGSIGCPTAGEAYTQVVTPGYRIVLRAAGDEFHYHGAAGQAPVYCADPAEDATVSGGGGA